MYDLVEVKSMVRLNEMAKRLGVSVKTLQRWDKDGTLVAHRTPKNRRYYTEEQYLDYIGNCDLKKRKHIVYARVSNSKQKDDLKNQEEFLRTYINAKGIIPDDFLSDIGSGLNYKRKKWNQLLDEVMLGEIDTIYITYKDRFVRFGYDWFEAFCNKFNTKIEVLNNVNTSPAEKIYNERRPVIGGVTKHPTYEEHWVVAYGFTISNLLVKSYTVNNGWGQNGIVINSQYLDGAVCI